MDTRIIKCAIDNIPVRRLKSGDTDDTSNSGTPDDVGDAVQGLKPVEEVESPEAPASNGSVSNGRTPPDGTQNRYRPSESMFDFSVCQRYISSSVTVIIFIIFSILCIINL